MKRNSAPHPCHGIKMRFVNPATGGYTMPTIGAFMQLLPAGFSGAAYRQTDATIYVVVEGEGRTRIGDQTYEWRPRDIFVIPVVGAHLTRGDEGRRVVQPVGSPSATGARVCGASRFL